MRVKRGKTVKKKHKKVLKKTKGYRMSKRRLIKSAKEALLHAGQYAYAGRKQRKRDFRRLWITRISHAVSSRGISYSKFINKLKKTNIKLDRKIMANMILQDPDTFEKLVEKIKRAKA